LILGLAVVLFAGSARAEDLRIVVRFKGTPDASVLAKHGAVAGDKIGRLDAVRATAPARALARLRADPNVALVEEDGIAEICAKPSGTAAPSQPPQTMPWGIAKVNAPLTGNTGAGIKVAIIDTGIDLAHPDLDVKGSVDFTGSRKGARDENGHGSHVAGTVAALHNSIGVVGCAPGAHLYAVRVLDRRGSGWWSDIAEGIDWAGQQGMQIANMSLGGGASSVVELACNDAEGAGVLLIAAAGNSGDGNTSTTEVSFPAAYGSVVAVGATSSNDNLASFSNTGSFVEVSGPGVSVPSTYKDGGYATLSGTSMASPHAAGIAALIWKELSSPTRSAVRSELQRRVRDLGPSGRDNGFGFGIVDFSK